MRGRCVAGAQSNCVSARQDQASFLSDTLENLSLQRYEGPSGGTSGNSKTIHTYTLKK